MQAPPSLNWLVILEVCPTCADEHIAWLQVPVDDAAGVEVGHGR
jgi:hypothetical protein